MKKIKKMQNGGSSKMKKYGNGGGKSELGPVYTQASGKRGGAGTYEPPTTIKTQTTKTKKMQMGGTEQISKTNPSNSAQMDRGVSKPNTPTTPSTPPPSSTTARDIRKMDRYENRVARKSKKYKTGGMVNSNSKVSALKSAGSKGVKSGTNPKATASKVARGRVGGTSTAPKTAIPKAQMGGMAGGIPISERAAARKVKKGKGTITKSYPSGPEGKGSYVGFSKEARKSNSPFKSMKDSKPARPIRKKGGAMKKGY